jgi:hypothetical protein
MRNPDYKMLDEALAYAGLPACVRVEHSEAGGELTPLLHALSNGFEVFVKKAGLSQVPLQIAYVRDPSLNAAAFKYEGHYWYGLTAAIEISRFDDALKLLAHAAIVAQGRDVFAQIVTQFVDTAVRFGYCHRLLQPLERNERGHELARCQFQIAAMLARLGVEQELASDLIRRGFAAIQQEDARLPEARRRGFSGDDVRDIALYGVATSKWTKRQ